MSRGKGTAAHRGCLRWISPAEGRPGGARHYNGYGLREFLFDLKRQDYARENFPGVLNVLIGRQVKAHNGVLVSMA